MVTVPVCARARGGVGVRVCGGRVCGSGRGPSVLEKTPWPGFSFVIISKVKNNKIGQSYKTLLSTTTKYSVFI